MSDATDRASLATRWRALGLNPHRIAKDLGMSWRTIRNIETRLHRSNQGTIQAINAYLSKLERQGKR